ncbi:alpha/beta fold hydrolase [Neorhizobium sp. NCHU2750]|uniref:alpha/beta fold hydrolase n=1 Tax=Neorhizobium sp. NCHU2750 TaxID=1825976 RepID=UPI000E724841|nr:3-oxoadipate enol-lactone hydrolase [Neorhizobium sp. NCHU2750]
MPNQNQHGGEDRESRINWIRTGPADAEAVLLIHPVGYDLTHWDMQIDGLRHAYDVIAFDLPGHGLSPALPEDFSFEVMAARVKSVIEASGHRAAHIVGISVGGMIAQTFALAQPDMTLSLTLVATASTFPTAAREGMRLRAQTVRQSGMAAILEPTLQRWFTPATLAERPHVIDRVTKVLLAGNPQVHAAMWEMIAGFDLHDRLDAIRCPTLILVGDQDPSTPPTAAGQMAERIGNSRLVVIEGASHMLAIERFERVNAEITSFLQG